MAAQISFDPRNLEDCERAIVELQTIIWQSHGAATVRRLFAGAVPSKQNVKNHKNAELMGDYLHCSDRHGTSVGQYAKMIAEQNKSLPRDLRRGPSGSTSPETLEKHIRREKKRMAQDPSYREYAEWLASIAYWEEQRKSK
jgi:hypothetical protein